MADPAVARESAEAHDARLSTFAGVPTDGESVEDLLRRLCVDGPIPNGKLRATTAGALRAAGFDFAYTPPPDCHYDVMLGTVTDEHLERFSAAFDEPIKNPTKGGRPA